MASPCIGRFALLVTFLLPLVVLGTTPASTCIAGSDDPTCLRQSSGTRSAQDHSLLQLNRLVAHSDDNATVVADASTTPCVASAVSRRRRHSTMCSCRRRHGRSDLAGNMRCEGNTIVVEGSSQPTAAPGASLNWGEGSPLKAGGLWCQVRMPPPEWNLKSCPVSSGASTNLKVLTYNLFWWNLFGRHDGKGQSAGRKIAQTSGPEQYDLMGFQECDDMYRILGDARDQGLSGEYSLLNGGRALAIAYRSSRFTWLADGSKDVGEDHRDQYYGKRSAQWVRLQHRDGQIVFFLNHHGPLPVSRSGGCTGSATAINLLKVIAENARAGDHVVVVGDFNAEPHSSRIQTLDNYLHRVYTGTSMGGVDHILSNCVASSTANLGSGGSDHDALSAVFRI